MRLVINDLRRKLGQALLANRALRRQVGERDARTVELENRLGALIEDVGDSLVKHEVAEREAYERDLESRITQTGTEGAEGNLSPCPSPGKGGELVAAGEVGGVGRRLSLSNKTHLDLNEELRRARSKFPENDRLLTALAEEFGEVANAMLEGKNWRLEALHVACVAIRIYEEGMAEMDEGEMKNMKIPGGY